MKFTIQLCTFLCASITRYKHIINIADSEKKNINLFNIRTLVQCPLQIYITN